MNPIEKSPLLHNEEMVDVLGIYITPKTQYIFRAELFVKTS